MRNYFCQFNPTFYRIFITTETLVEALWIFLEHAYSSEHTRFKERMRPLLDGTTEDELREPVKLFELIYGSMLHGYGFKDGHCSFMWHSMPGCMTPEGAFQLFTEDGDKDFSVFIHRFPIWEGEIFNSPIKRGEDGKFIPHDGSYRVVVGAQTKEKLVRSAKEISAAPSWNVRVSFLDCKHNLTPEEAVELATPEFSEMLLNGSA